MGSSATARFWTPGPGGVNDPGARATALDNSLVLTKLFFVASLLQTLGTPRRREILRLVWDEEKSAGDIHRALGDVTFGAVSQHLRVLQEAALLRGRREGRHRFYVARKDELGPLARWLEAMWDDALYSLKLRAELEESRRGPGARRRRSPAARRRR
jgi:DNA-binding transcriptional ArsR family regulator